MTQSHKVSETTSISGGGKKEICEKLCIKENNVRLIQCQYSQVSLCPWWASVTLGCYASIIWSVFTCAYHLLAH